MLNPELVTAIGGIIVAVLVAFAGNKLFSPGKPDPIAALIRLLEKVERQSGTQTTTYERNMEYLKDLTVLVNAHLTAMNTKLETIIVLINDVRLDNARHNSREG